MPRFIRPGTISGRAGSGVTPDRPRPIRTITALVPSAPALGPSGGRGNAAEGQAFDSVTSCQILIAQTQALQERGCLGILHGLVLCSGVLYGRDLYPCILLPPDLC
jgi:hypothetical protein